MIDQYLLNASSTTSLGITNSHFLLPIGQKHLWIMVYSSFKSRMEWSILLHIGHLCGIVAVLLYYEWIICSWIVEWFLHQEFVVQRNTSHNTLNNFHVTLLQTYESYWFTLSPYLSWIFKITSCVSSKNLNVHQKYRFS